MTFQVNDASTASGAPAVWVTITENADGTLSFNVTQQGGIIGDLRGLFFDVADESILGSLKVTSDSTDVRIGNDNITNLGDGANMQGLTGDDKGYDVGIEVGTSGIGKDDYSSYEFTLGSTARPLTLADFSNVNFGVRLTSVGTIDGARTDSSKIMETTFTALDAQDDAASVDENNAASGNVLANDDTNDTASGSLNVTGWSGGDLGATVELADTEGATLQLNADGSYTLDASASDALSQGEKREFTFTYDTLQQVDGDSATDQATFKVTVYGVNDGPVADDDNAGSITEDQTATGTTRANDSDVDRADSISVTAVNGIADGAEGDLDANAGSIQVLLASGALVTMNADGTFSYDTNGAFESLNDGQQANDSFVYTLADNHGATDDATVSLSITGVTDVIDPPPPVDDPELDVLFNHGTNDTDHGFFPQESDGNDKTNVVDDFTENDTLKIAGYGDADDLTIYEGDFGLGDADIDDTLFVIGIDGNRTSTRTEDWGYIEDYTGLTEEQIDVTGNKDIDIVDGTYNETLVDTYDINPLGA